METRKLSSSRLKLAVANFVMFQTGSVTSRGIFRNFLIAQSSKKIWKNINYYDSRFHWSIGVFRQHDYGAV